MVISAQVEAIRTLGDTPDGMAARQRMERERTVIANRTVKREDSTPDPEAMEVDGADKVKKEEVRGLLCRRHTCHPIFGFHCC